MGGGWSTEGGGGGQDREQRGGDGVASLPGDPWATVAGAPRVAEADGIGSGEEETVVYDGSHPDLHAAIQSILSFYA